MFVENLNARNWASRNTMDIAFVVGRDALGLEEKPIGGGPLRIQTDTLGAFGINAVNGSLPGRSPAPSSNHPGGSINVAFCDGRVIGISESIDARVWARLMTPNGLTFGQSIVGNGEF
jgi:prepilin-type processing-associated H-X9-DG protein